MKNLPIYKRGEMLGHIASLTKNITVVGSHGKTTTTSLIASIFSKTKIDPTIVNGGVLNSFNSSARLGNSNWSILELDESDGSFIEVLPTYSIITNIDRDKNFSKFDLKIFLPGKKKETIKNIKIPILGIHNIRNATAAVAVSITIGISKKIIKKGLLNFQGVQRRFNKLFSFKGAEFYDDYAHHPTEIREVLNSVREAYKKQKITCIFQPHRISRLKDLKKEFTLSFKKADQVILCPIFTAGEKIKLGFEYYNFAKELANNSRVELFLVKDKKNLATFVKQNIQGNKIVIGMGAGSISNWMRDLPNLL